MGEWKKQAHKEAVLKSDLLGKGHAHKVKRPAPIICPACDGMTQDVRGYECLTCEGLGYIEGEE